MSTSRRVEQRLRRRRPQRLVVGAIFVAVSAVYLSWRLTIFNSDALVLSSVFFTAEVIGLVLGLSTIFVSFSYNHREPKAPPEGLSVDVFVLTYQEPVELLRRTLRGAVGITYPHETWLLDDGDRPEMKALAEELGVRYIARKENTHAKAGNINNALKHSTADFVATFDADHIPMPRALDVLLGFVDDPEVALVQAPQDFYNITSFQYIDHHKAGGLWHDQSYFYDVMQGCKDSENAATCVGTSVLYRRSALDEIGGIPWQTVTEDMHTSLLLHRKGYKAVYINEAIAYGVGAVDLGEYYKTRLRWGHGNVHALRHENILTCSGLTLRQRLYYLTLGLVYLEGWQQIIMYTVPVYSLLTGTPPFDISIFNILCMIAYPVFGYLMLQELACGYGHYWLNEMFSMTRFPIYIRATFAIVRNKMAWKSSSKAFKGRIEWRLLAPQLTVLTLSLVALAVGVYRNLGEFELGPLGRLIFLLDTDVDLFASFAPGYNVDLLLIAGFWAVFNVIRCTLFVNKVRRNVAESHEEFRFPVPLPIEIELPHGRVKRVTVAISLNAVTVPDIESLPEGTVPGTVYLPSGPLAVQLHSFSRAGENLTEARFTWPDRTTSDRLADSLLSVDWHRNFIPRAAYFRTPLEFLGDVLLRRKPHKPRDDSQGWQPVVLTVEKGESPVSRLGYVRPLNGESGVELVSFCELSGGNTVGIRKFCDTDATPSAIIVPERARTRPFAHQGLDGHAAKVYCLELDEMRISNAANSGFRQHSVKVANLH